MKEWFKSQCKEVGTDAGLPRRRLHNFILSGIYVASTEIFMDNKMTDIVEIISSMRAPSNEFQCRNR